MNEMIERVARAMYKSRNAGRPNACEWGELPSSVKESERRDARAAIEAMREPTEKMVRPDGTHFWMPYFDCHREDDAAGIWRLMIDAALKEQEQPSAHHTSPHGV